jgi:Zn-dependent peptidase ImmA (M78 family)
MEGIKPRTGYVRAYARTLLKRHGIDAPPVDLRLLTQKEGLEYQEVDYFPDDVDALIIRMDGRTVAAVNGNQSPARRRFSLAHELAHFFLHEDRSVLEFGMSIDNGPSNACEDPSSTYEVEANIFASELLIPLAWLKSQYRHGMSAEDVAGIFHVSEAAASVAMMQHFKSLF